MQSQNTSAKNADWNKFQVLADEEKEEGEFVVGEETNTLQEVEAPNVLPSHDMEEQLAQSPPVQTHTEARPDSSANNGGTCTQSKTRATVEEVSENSNEEPELQ